MSPTLSFSADKLFYHPEVKFLEKHFEDLLHMFNYNMINNSSLFTLDVPGFTTGSPMFQDTLQS